jgi:hypothetical protein
MPDLDQPGATSGRTTSGRGPSRRSVLRGAAGAGAAGLAAGTLAQLAVAAPADASSRTDSRTDSALPASQEASGSEAVVAHVRDAATGEIDVFHGTSVTRVRDKALAAQLVRASR